MGSFCGSVFRVALRFMLLQGSRLVASKIQLGSFLLGSAELRPRTSPEASSSRRRAFPPAVERHLALTSSE